MDVSVFWELFFTSEWLEDFGVLFMPIQLAQFYIYSKYHSVHRFLIDTVLFYHEHFAAHSQQLVQFVRGQFLEGFFKIYH